MMEMKDNCFNDGSIFEMVRQENKRQLEKWGIQTHTAFEWLAYLTEELGELAKAISEYEYRDGERAAITAEAVQVATLALKMVEMSILRGK